MSAFKVDKHVSSKGKVVLRDLTRLAEGYMRCEISAEAPSFHTTAKALQLQVVGELVVLDTAKALQLQVGCELVMLDIASFKARGRGKFQ